MALLGSAGSKGEELTASGMPGVNPPEVRPDSGGESYGRVVGGQSPAPPRPRLDPSHPSPSARFRSAAGSQPPCNRSSD